MMGLRRDRPVIAWTGFACCLLAGLILGILLALPTAIFFCVYIKVTNSEPAAYVTQNAASVIAFLPFPAGNVYVTIKGKQEGPFNQTQLRTLWNAGAVHPGSFYWQEGMAEWKPVRDLIST
jgi:hypothetical protein